MNVPFSTHAKMKGYERNVKVMGRAQQQWTLLNIKLRYYCQWVSNESMDDMTCHALFLRHQELRITSSRVYTQLILLSCSNKIFNDTSKSCAHFNLL